MDDTEKLCEEIARRFLDEEKRLRQFNHPEPAGILVTWKGSLYIGSVQEAVPEFSKEIVVLSITSVPQPVKLVDAVRKLDPGRLDLTADDELDLTGRQHVLRKVENRLTRMTPEQTAYMLLRPMNIYEICSIFPWMPLRRVNNK